MNKKYQIFVSSTYKDLLEERQLAIDTIMKLNHIPAGMELFSATGENQFESIKPIIFESDYYLLILAGKYGSLAGNGLSYTEMEYDYAVKNNIRIIAFIHGDPENLQSDLRESKDRMKNKLNKFKKKVMENKMVSIWYNKTDLLQRISVSISTVINVYPAKTCWIHVNENDMYTPIDNYVALEDIIFLDEKLNNVCGSYYHDLDEDVLKVVVDNLLKMSISLPTATKAKHIDEYAGCFIRMTPKNKDWARYILNDYHLMFQYQLEKDIDLIMYLEIKNYISEIYKKVIKLKCEEEKVVDVYLKDYINDINDWKKIKEICFVFRPVNTEVNNQVTIHNIRLQRND